MTPPTPKVPSYISRRLWGLLHKALAAFSGHIYCPLFNVYFQTSCMQLPFGLVLKWTDRTSVEEVIAMQMARAAGMPVPKYLGCGEYPRDKFNGWISILMTRLPGYELNNSDATLDVDAEGLWIHELNACLDAMRQWEPPFENKKQISSAIGTAIRSIRVPEHIMGPFANETEMHAYLLSTSSAHGFKSIEDFEGAKVRARKLEFRPHRVVFTHGDLMAHNILVDEQNRLSGFLDWVSGGWCPEYWDFTTAMKYGKDSWWYQAVGWMGGNEYLEEQDGDRALNDLTVDSWVGFE
ncbi:hypothetical protein AJ79_03609 [Helicocarpus griseus UAMH5409]|uniref:Aminoglycoside phosphotransferase domain-containing protein n=1 Tax=Helicocarpus griseus UAMH5409 TaxID=1447875 RepID=A0A2B7XX23_9EURO|nr:hypothetical protein AJ79_03609 [Helicocarpus griseus UAMH5409]